MVASQPEYQPDILLIEDQLSNVEDVRSVMMSSGWLYNLRVAGDEGSVIAEMEKKKPDVIVCSFQLNWNEAFSVLKFCKSKSIIPFIYISEPIGEKNAVKAILEGADDLLLIEDLSLLPEKIRTVMDKHHKGPEEKITEVGKSGDDHFYRNLAEQSWLTVWKTDKHLRLTYLSPSFLPLTGYAAEDWLGQPVHELFDNAEGIPNIRWIHKNALFMQNSSGFRFNTQFNRKDGIPIYLEITGSPLLENGMLTGLQGTAGDISEQKAAEIKMANDLTTMQELYTTLPVGLLKTGANGQTVSINPQFRILAGLSDQEENDWKENVHPNDKTRVTELFTVTGNHRQELVSTFRFIDTTEKITWVQCHIIPQTRNDEFSGLDAVFTDITEFKITEGKLTERETRLRDAIDKAPFPIMIHHQGRILQLSAAFTEITGYTINEISTLDKWREIATPIEEEFNNPMIRPVNPMTSQIPTGPWKVKTKKYGPRIWEFNFSPGGSVEFDKSFITSMATDVTHKKQMEDELFRSRQELNAIFQGAPIMMFLLNIRREVIKINQTAVNYASKTRIEILGKPVGNALNCFDSHSGEKCGDKPICSQCQFNHLLDEIYDKNNNNSSAELHLHMYRNLQPSRRIFSATAERLFGENEPRILLTLQDITDRKEAEIELKNSEEKFRNLIENAPVGIALISNGGKIRDINNAGMGLFGFEIKNEMIGLNIHEFFSDGQERLLFQEKLEDGSAFGLETRMTDRNGNPIWLMQTAVKQDFPDGELGYMAILEDINIRKENEAQIRLYQENLEGLINERTKDLEESNQQLSKLYKAIEYSPVSVIITDDVGTIEYANPHFFTITGYDREEAVGKNPRIIKSEDTPKEYYQNMWQELKSGQVWHGQFKNRTKHGELFWELCSIAPIFGANNQITHYVAVKQDITEKMQAEEKMKSYTRELEIFNKSMVDRELRMIEMKEEVNKMCRMLGIPERFQTGWDK